MNMPKTKKIDVKTPICYFPNVLFRDIFEKAMKATNCQGVELYMKLWHSSLDELAQYMPVEEYKSQIKDGLEKRYVKGDYIIGDSFYFDLEPKRVKELTFKKRLDHQYSIELLEDDEDEYSFAVILHFSTKATPNLEFNKETNEISAPPGDVISHKALGCDTASFTVGMKKTGFYNVRTLSDGYYADIYSTKNTKEHMIIFSIAYDALSPTEFMNGLRATLEPQVFKQPSDVK